VASAEGSAIAPALNNEIDSEHYHR